MSRILISYRRSDSAAIAGRVYDRLVDRYGEASVFMDVDKIPFGTDFRQHIRDVLRTSDILLAVVGPRWTAASPDGKARIMDEADPVRVEIDTALQQGMVIIPLLVDSATMPGVAELPESIRDFAYINAAPVDSGRDFRAHLERVIRSMDEVLATKAAAQPHALPAAHGTDSPARRRAPGLVIASILAVLVAGAAAGIVLAPGHWFGSTPTPAPTNTAAKLDSKGPAPVPSSNPDVPVATPAEPKATYRVLANVSGGVQNLRKGPALKYPIVVAIPAGASGIALGDCRKAEDNSRPWCAATWRDHAGWISSCCIVDEKTGAPPRVP